MNSTGNIQLENCEGPMDLLLGLVRDKKMDIMEINLYDLATKYLELIDQLKDQNLDLASEYLVMAATLLHIKTKMLLEEPNAKEELEAEKIDILKKLSEYQQYKKVAEELRVKEIQRKDIFIKEAEDYDGYALFLDESKLDGKSDAIKLIQQLRKMFERVYSNRLKQTTLEKFNLSPAERRLELIELFKRIKNPTFSDIFSVPTINHFVVTLLTVLDMARKQELKLEQDEQFGDIRIIQGEING